MADTIEIRRGYFEIENLVVQHVEVREGERKSDVVLLILVDLVMYDSG